MDKIDKLGNIGNGKSQSRTVYGIRGVSPTLTSGMTHGNTIPYIVMENEMKVLGHMEEGSNQRYVLYDKNEECPTLQSAMGTGGGNVPYVAIDEQNMLVKEDVIGTLTTDGSSPKHNNRVLDRRDWRIRKLTPRECFRLMDFSDRDFDAAARVNSNSQLYKEAGNSIVQNVLVAAIGQLFEGKEDVYKNVQIKKEDMHFTKHPFYCDELLDKVSKLHCIGQMDNTADHTLESANRVYSPDGICPTIPTCQGGGIEPKVIVKDTVCLNRPNIVVKDGNNEEESVIDRTV